MASWRTRLACDRGEAASWRRARKLGHIRKVGSSDRQVPQPWQLEAISTKPSSGQRRAGSITGTADSRACSPARDFDCRVGRRSQPAADSACRREFTAAPGAAERRLGLGLGSDGERRASDFKSAEHQVGVVADDLARVELAQWVERVFDLAEYLGELAELFAEELGAGQAAGLRARDRAARLEDDVVNPAGQRLELGPVARVGQIEERPESQPAFAGVGVERPGEVLLLEQTLKPLQHRSELVRRDSDVVDERDRARTAAKPHEQGLDQPAQAEHAARTSAGRTVANGGGDQGSRRGCPLAQTGEPWRRPTRGRRLRIRRSGSPRPPRRSSRGTRGRRRVPG